MKKWKAAIAQAGGYPFPSFVCEADLAKQERHDALHQKKYHEEHNEHPG